MTDWEAIASEYVTGKLSYQKLAEKHGIPYPTLRDQARKNKWYPQRKEHRKNVVQNTVQNAEKKIADKQSEVIALQADTALRIAQQINDYLTSGRDWKPFDLLRITNCWQILQDNLNKKETETESQQSVYVAILPERTEIDEGG